MQEVRKGGGRIHGPEYFCLGHHRTGPTARSRETGNRKQVLPRKTGYGGRYPSLWKMPVRASQQGTGVPQQDGRFQGETGKQDHEEEEITVTIQKWVCRIFSPLERGKGCVRTHQHSVKWMHFTHPLPPLKRGEYHFPKASPPHFSR